MENRIYSDRVPLSGLCTAPGCDRETRLGRLLCDLHEKRRTRGTIPMNAPVRQRYSPWGRLVAAALQLADCDSEDDLAFDHATAALRRAAAGWCSSRGWHPPADETQPERAAEAA